MKEPIGAARDEPGRVLDEESASRWLLFLLLSLTLLYAPLLLADYAWDDEALVLARASALSEGEEASIHGDLWQATGAAAQDSGYYRPLFLLSLDADRVLAGSDPGWAHIHSLLWHLLACLSLFGVTRRIVPAPAALLGVAFFGFHPLQTEAIAWVSARNDPMAAALGLTGVWILLEARGRLIQLAVASLLLFLALLSKEHAVVFPLLLIGMRWVRSEPLADPRVLVATFLPVLGYVALRLSAEVSVPGGALPGLGEIARAGFHYLGLVVWPWPLSVARTLAELEWTAHLLVTGLLGATLITVLALSLRRGVSVGLFFAIAAALPVLVSLGSYGQLGDRFAYLPLAGLGLALASALPRSIPRRHALLYLLAVGGIGFSLVSARLPDWRDSEQLWTAEVERLGTSLAHAQLANLLHRDGLFAEAAPYYLGALSGPAPRLDRCPDAVRLTLELSPPSLGLALFEAMDHAGCPTTGAAGGARSLLLALAGQWTTASALAEAAEASDPNGRALLVLAAAALRTDDNATYQRMAERYAERGVERNDFDAMVLALILPSLTPSEAPATPPKEAEAESD